MPKQAYLGTKVRRLRQREALTQVELANRLGISASYLNLIEHNQRTLTVPLLLKLAQLFHVELESFAEDDDSLLAGELREVLVDPLFEGRRIGASEIRDLVTHAPEVSRGLLELYRAYRAARRSAMTPLAPPVGI